MFSRDISKRYISEERLLRSHGFEQWPTEDELVRYLFSTNDKLDVLISTLGLSGYRDIRGCWAIESDESDSEI